MFIVRFTVETGRAPTAREIGEALHLSSTGHIGYHLVQLERRGMLRFTGRERTSRRIRLHVPLWVPVLGCVGVRGLTDPFSGLENASKTLRALHGGPSYALHVCDDSLSAERIAAGDYIVVDPHKLPPNGASTVALCRSVGTNTWRPVVARYYHDERHAQVVLRPISSTQPTLEIPAIAWKPRWRVLGQVTMVARFFPATESDELRQVPEQTSTKNQTERQKGSVL